MSESRGTPSRTAPLPILMAEDDDDFFLTNQAMKEARLPNPLGRVKDGEGLLEHLTGRGPFADRVAHPMPALLLLDPNMPREDGREALREIKATHALRALPVVVLTTSRAEEDVVRSYDLGVNSFVTKPVTFNGLVEVLRVLGRYWFEIVELPSLGNHPR